MSEGYPNKLPLSHFLPETKPGARSLNMRFALDKRPPLSYIPASSLVRDAFARVLSDAERVRCPRVGHTPAPGRLRTPPGR